MSLGRAGDCLELAVKGAPEALLERCSRVCGPVDDGQFSSRSLTKQRRRAAKSVVDGLAADGLRVLAVARRSVTMPITGEPPPLTELVEDLTLIGFVGIADVMRPEAAQIVAALANAGVRTVMITGDHPATAAAIARAAGLPSAGNVLVGDELDSMAESERRNMVDGCVVFARVSPQQKVRIVGDLQRAGHVVAMTGDGTNDAAAIRLADVGIGVSARGSTAARNASDLILTVGNLSDMADALAEGRALWCNVANALSILVGGNVGEITFMIAGTALGDPARPGRLDNRRSEHHSSDRGERSRQSLLRDREGGRLRVRSGRRRPPTLRPTQGSGSRAAAQLDVVDRNLERAGLVGRQLGKPHQYVATTCRSRFEPDYASGAISARDRRQAGQAR